MEGVVEVVVDLVAAVSVVAADFLVVAADFLVVEAVDFQEAEVFPVVVVDLQAVVVDNPLQRRLALSRNISEKSRSRPMDGRIIF